MGWWTSADGLGLIGDRPADILAGALRDALGARFDVDLLAGFLTATGAALRRNPEVLLSGGIPEGAVIVATFSGAPDVEAPVLEPVVRGGLDDALLDALDSVAYHYRLTELERAPRLTEVLETLAFVAHGRVTALDGTPLDLTGIVVANEADRLAAPHAWAAMRAIAAGDVAPDAGLIAGALDDPDWRARATGALVAGRHGMAALAPRVQAVEIPPAGAGLRDEDRRALLAMRDVAAARAAGAPLERPRHDDPALDARRSAFLTEIDDAISGTAMPDPGSPAYVIRALVDPEAIRAPAAWKRWL